MHTCAANATKVKILCAGTEQSVLPPINIVGKMSLHVPLSKQREPHCKISTFELSINTHTSSPCPGAFHVSIGLGFCEAGVHITIFLMMVNTNCGRQHPCVCMCVLQVEATSTPAPAPPSPSIIHGGCQTSHSSSNFPPPFQNLGWICWFWQICPICQGFLCCEFRWNIVGWNMGVERVMGFCIFLVGSQIDERSSSGGEFEGMGSVGPGLPQAAAWFTRWFLGSDAPLYRLYRLCAVGKSWVFAKLVQTQHNTHPSSFISALCVSPSMQWQLFMCLWVCQYEKSREQLTYMGVLPIRSSHKLAKREPAHWQAPLCLHVRRFSAFSATSALCLDVMCDCANGTVFTSLPYCRSISYFLNAECKW